MSDSDTAVPLAPGSALHTRELLARQELSNATPSTPAGSTTETTEVRLAVAQQLFLTSAANHGSRFMAFHYPANSHPLEFSAAYTCSHSHSHSKSFSATSLSYFFMTLKCAKV
jgi:hypothetical protein